MSKAAELREINDTIRYTMWSVFSLRDVLGDADRAAEAVEVDALLEKLAADDVVVRGIYDLSGIRADADLMVWWHAETAEQLQDAYNRLRRTAFGSAPGAGLEPARAAPARGVQQEPRAGLPRRRGGRGPTSASTRSCARTSGTSSTRPTGAGCWPSTVRWPAGSPTCAPTR